MDEPAAAVYLALEAIPELGAEPGDHVVVAPADVDYPLQVVRNFDRRALARFMGRDTMETRLQLVAGDLAPLPPARSRPRRLRGKLKVVR